MIIPTMVMHQMKTGKPPHNLRQALKAIGFNSKMRTPFLQWCWINKNTPQRKRNKAFKDNTKAIGFEIKKKSPQWK